MANRRGAEGPEKPNEDIVLKKTSVNYVFLYVKLITACANFLPVWASWMTGASDFLPPRRQARKGKSLFPSPRISFPWRPLRRCAIYSDSVAALLRSGSV